MVSFLQVYQTKSFYAFLIYTMRDILTAYLILVDSIAWISSLHVIKLLIERNSNFNVNLGTGTPQMLRLYCSDSGH
jgi:hypothetical protein